MSTNYRDAAVRHYLDGDTLRSGLRHPNADQLYGLSAECSLKAVMVGLGMQFTKKGAPKDRAHKVHMPDVMMGALAHEQCRTLLEVLATPVEAVVMLHPTRRPRATISCQLLAPAA